MKTRFNLYYYFFYKLYLIFLRLWGRRDFPHQTAMLAVATLFSINLLTLIPVVQLVTGFDFIESVHPTLIQLIIFSVLLIGVFQHVFMYDKKYENIIKKFKFLKEDVKKRWDRFFVIYIIATYFSLIFFSFVARHASSSGFTVVRYLRSLVG